MYIDYLKNIKASSVKLLLKKIVYLKNILGGSKEEKILKEGISI